MHPEPTGMSWIRASLRASGVTTTSPGTGPHSWGPVSSGTCASKPPDPSHSDIARAATLYTSALRQPTVLRRCMSDAAVRSRQPPHCPFPLPAQPRTMFCPYGPFCPWPMSKVTSSARSARGTRCPDLGVVREDVRAPTGLLDEPKTLLPRPRRAWRATVSSSGAGRGAPGVRVISGSCLRGGGGRSPRPQRRRGARGRCAAGMPSTSPAGRWAGGRAAVSERLSHT